MRCVTELIVIEGFLMHLELFMSNFMRTPGAIGLRQRSHRNMANYFDCNWTQHDSSHDRYDLTLLHLHNKLFLIFSNVVVTSLCKHVHTGCCHANCSMY